MTSVIELSDDSEFMEFLAECGQKLVVVVSSFFNINYQNMPMRKFDTFYFIHTNTIINTFSRIF